MGGDVLGTVEAAQRDPVLAVPPTIPSLSYQSRTAMAGLARIDLVGHCGKRPDGRSISR